MNLKKKLRKEWGIVEIGEGIYLWTRTAILEDQREWDEYDEAKDFDFSCCEYWITTNDGHKQGFDALDEVLEYLKDMEKWGGKDGEGEEGEEIA